MESPYIGQCDPDPEDRYGAILRRFLERAHLYALNAFFSSAPTWTSTSGKGHRIDFLPATESLHACCTQASVDVNMDLTTHAGHEDRSTVKASFIIERQLPSPVIVRRQLCCDKAALAVPEKMHAFRRLLEESPSWPNELHFELVLWITEAAATAFLKGAKRPRKDWIGGYTWGLQSRRLTWRRRARFCRWRVRAARMRACKTA